jgi:hypothetical protein
MIKALKPPIHSWIGRLVMWYWAGSELAQSTLLAPDIRQEIFTPQSQHVHGSSLAALPMWIFWRFGFRFRVSPPPMMFN